MFEATIKGFSGKYIWEIEFFIGGPSKAFNMQKCSVIFQERDVTCIFLQTCLAMESFYLFP